MDLSMMSMWRSLLIHSLSGITITAQVIDNKVDVALLEKGPYLMKVSVKGRQYLKKFVRN